jgi:succinate dehydrogenase / fumarate reductase cytochrome b subunit
MAVSILHRATGSALSFAGLGILTWWLVAIASGPDAYATFVKAATHPLGLIVLIGLTWGFFQHLLSGIRHLVMDTGAAFDLGINKAFAILTVVGSVLLTALTWFYLLGVAKRAAEQAQRRSVRFAASARRIMAASTG